MCLGIISLLPLCINKIYGIIIIVQLDRKSIAQEIINERVEVDLIEAYRALNITMVGYRFGLMSSEKSSARITSAAATIVHRLEAASAEEIRGKTWLDFARDVPECQGIELDSQEQAYFDAFHRLLAEPQYFRVTIGGTPSLEELKQKMRGESRQTTELQNAVQGNVRVILSIAARKKLDQVFRLGQSRLHSDDPVLSQIKNEINPTVLALEELLTTVGDS